MFRHLTITGPEHTLLAHPFLPDGDGGSGDGGAGGGGGNTSGGQGNPAAGGQQGGQQQQPPGNSGGAGDGGTDWQKHARTWETRAGEKDKEIQRLQAENEKFRQAALSDAEKAIEAARAEGEKAGFAKVAPRLVQSELRAALAHVSDDQRSALLEGIDPGRFLKDGEPDSDAIKAWAAKAAPAAPAGRGGSLPLGGRTPAAKPTDMNDLIRRHAGITPSS